MAEKSQLEEGHKLLSDAGPSGSTTDVVIASGASSIEERCPICLDDYQDKAFITTCFPHAFCFGCVVRAAAVTGRECPLCKARFAKVIHNVRSNDDYDVHKFRHVQNPSSGSVPPGNRDLLLSMYNWRRSLRVGDAASAITTRTIRGGGGVVESSSQAGRRRFDTSLNIGRARGASGGEQGVEGGGGDVREQGRSIRRHCSCWSSTTRRSVYLAGVWAQLPCSSGDRGRRVRDTSASYFRRNPASRHRLMDWLSRDVEVLLGREHVQFMNQLVFSIIDKVDLGDEAFAAHLQPFLNDKTVHFMHELISFAKSPYDMIAYDARVIYDWPPGHPLRNRPHPVSCTSGHCAGRRPCLSKQEVDMNQKIFRELTSTCFSDDSPDSSPLQFCSSPIIIHGSSSEDEVSATHDSHLPGTRAVTEISQRGPRPLNPPTQGNRSSVEDEETNSPVENRSAASPTVPPASLLEVGRPTVLETRNASRLEPQVLASEVNESLDVIEIFVGAANMEMQSSFTGMSSSMTQEEGKSAMESGLSGRPLDVKLGCGEGDSERPAVTRYGIKDDSSVKSPRLEKRYRNRSKDRRRSSDVDNLHYHHNHHHHHDRRRTVSRSPPHRRKMTESRKGKSSGRGERRSPSESSERDRKSAQRKQRVVEEGSEKDDRRERGHKSAMYPDKLETTSTKEAGRNQRLSSCTSISTESGGEYRHRQHHHHQRKHNKEKRKKRMKGKKASKKKLIADHGKASRNLSLESDQHKHDSSVSRTAVNMSRGKDHVTQEDLLNETHAIEEGIRSGKLKILKSSLRKERIELLHRHKQGTSTGDGTGGGADMCLDEVLRARLAELDEEIVTEKRQLLLVMKRMEERNFN